MPDVEAFEPGGYRFIRGQFQYSGGVVAEPGFAIERATFASPVPLVDGFAAVKAHLASIGRPTTAFCACELRSPEPFSESGFVAFNRIYVGTLAEWGIYDAATETNPVARSNVCPEINPPPEPSFYAFSYTVPAVTPAAAPTWVVSGSGEAPEGKGSYGDHVVRPGDTSPEGMADKARAVLGEMERRMSLLGAGWTDTTGVNTYTVFDIHPFLDSEMVARGATRTGLTWHFDRPPVVGLDFEMDCRAVTVERFLPNPTG